MKLAGGWKRLPAVNKKMRTIVLDLETKKLFSEVPNGENKYLGVSVVGIYDSADDQLKAFFEDELSQLWPILENADLVVGFNIKKFDLEVLQPYYSGNLSKLPVLDLLNAVRDAAGFRLKLDDLAHATLGKRKTGTGLQALQFFKEGKLEELKNYCLNDVIITRDLYLYAVKNGVLKYNDLGNVLKEIPVNLQPLMPKKSEQQMSLGV